MVFDPSIDLCHVNKMPEYLVVPILPCTVFNTMIATCPPSQNLPFFCCIIEQLQDMECFFSPSPFHAIFPTPQLAQRQQSLI